MKIPKFPPLAELVAEESLPRKFCSSIGNRSDKMQWIMYCKQHANMIADNLSEVWKAYKKYQEISSRLRPEIDILVIEIERFSLSRTLARN